jgi:Na+/H+-dicarboxylate symporter
MSNRFTLFIVGGMLLGVVIGAALHSNADLALAQTIAGYFSLVTHVFLRLISMIIAPLVFSTLVGGIAHMDPVTAGRIGARTIAWFVVASAVSLLIGIVMAHLMHPGAGLNLSLPSASAAPVVSPDLSLKEFLDHVFPTSVIHAMGENQILQIVVFSLFAGVGLGALGQRGANLLAAIEQLAMVMLKITDAVMTFAPVAVCAAIVATVATSGLGILKTYAAFVGSFYLSLVVLWSVLIVAGFSLLGRSVFGLLRAIRQAVLVAFSTASSEAAYPRTLEALEEFGVPRRIAGLVLPLGYSFNLDGSIMYTAFAILFIAQVYGIHLTLSELALMGVILFVTSKGIAGVPRASLVVIAATLPFLRLPEAGLLLIIGVDQFLDMGRTATNVVGNSIASAVVAAWEGTLAAREGPRPSDRSVGLGDARVDSQGDRAKAIGAGNDER